MNKLYILGALALAGADAFVAFRATGGLALTAMDGTTNTFATAGLAGSYVYTYTGDCLSSGNLLTLGMNNNYYQYYYATLAGGTSTYTAIGPSLIYTATGIPAATGILTSIAGAYSGCWHAHIYNWVAMPSLTGSGAVTSVNAGFGSAVCAYGYSMVGTATTDCIVSAIVTTALFLATGSTFEGGAYQSSILTVTAWTDTAIISIVPVWGTQGPGYYATTAGTAVITAGTAAGLTLTTQNSYWDFMQSNVIMGLTTLGRGGGTLGTGPCGWYVGYFYEAPSRGVYFDTDSFNVAEGSGSVTLSFWTDNSVLKAASAFVVAGLAGLLF